MTDLREGIVAAEPESVDDFRARARAWIRGNLPASTPSDQVGYLRPRFTDEEELAEVDEGPPAAAEVLRRRSRRRLRSRGVRRLGPHAGAPDGVAARSRRASRIRSASRRRRSRRAPRCSSSSAPTSRSSATSRRSSRARSSGCSSCPSRAAAPTSAAALTTAVRDGDEWILNGSKVWTTGAWWSDWGLCLARTNWDVPKHRGLSVFILPLHQPGIEIHRIEMLNGSKDFCQEFITDVRVPDTARIGDVNEGWTVGTRWMFHERMLHNSPYVTVRDGQRRQRAPQPAQRRHRPRQPAASTTRVRRDLLGEAYMLELVGEVIQHRIAEGIRPARCPTRPRRSAACTPASSTTRLTSIAFELAGARRDRVDRRPTAPPRRSATTTCSGRSSTSAAARPRWPATSSASGSSACRASCRTTATPCSATSPKAHLPSSQTTVAMSERSDVRTVRYRWV